MLHVIQSMKNKRKKNREKKYFEKKNAKNYLKIPEKILIYIYFCYDKIYW